jgi:hypothetical protein
VSFVQNKPAKALPLDILPRFVDTLEELDVTDAQFYSKATGGGQNVWPRVRYLRLTINVQDKALLVRSFPNVKYAELDGGSFTRTIAVTDVNETN